MGINIDLANVTENGGWIEGDIVVDVQEFGFNQRFPTHFKTLKDTSTTIDLGGDVTLIVSATLTPPKTACIKGRITRPPFGFDLPEKCVTAS